MASITVTDYKQASDTLRLTDLRQSLYDEDAILMEKVLVNLHGAEHRTRRNFEAKVFRRDFFQWYEREIFPTTLNETLRPYLSAGKLDLVDFGFRVMMNLTVDFAGIALEKNSGLNRKSADLTKFTSQCPSKGAQEFKHQPKVERLTLSC